MFNAAEKETITTSRTPGDRSAWSQQTNYERFIWVLKTPLRAVLCASHITLFFLTYFGFMIPILWARKLWPRLYWYYEGKLYIWLQAFVGYWGYTAGYDIFEYGDELSTYCENERLLVLCNHQSTADVPTLMAVLQNKNVASRKTLWLMDVMFRWTPFGLIGRMHGDHFIKQGKDTRAMELERLKKHLREVFWDRDRRWVIVFPEGGFLYKRIESSQRFGRLNGFPHLRFTTLPRIGAVKSILEEIGPRENSDSYDRRSRSGSKLKLIKDTVGAIREKKYIKETRPPIKYLLDVTIAYPHFMPLSLLTLCFGTREKCHIGVNYKIYDAKEVPFHDETKLRDWLYELYRKKDQMLENYYEKGTFVDGEIGTRINFPWSKITSQYIFWLSSFYTQYRAYSWLIRQFFLLLSISFYSFLRYLRSAISF